jgi:hypothetical protein
MCEKWHDECRQAAHRRRGKKITKIKRMKNKSLFNSG